MELQVADLLSLGLISSLHCYSTFGVLEQFRFLHLTIQEFLAARHIASDAMSNEEKRQFLKTNIVNEKFRMTFLFLAGLTHLNFLLPYDPLLEGYLSGDDQEEKLLFLAQLIYESKSSSIPLLNMLKSRLDMSGRFLSKFDCLALAYILSATPENHVWEVIKIVSHGYPILLAQKHLTNPNVPAIAMTKKLILATDEGKEPTTEKLLPAVTSVISTSRESPLEELQLTKLATEEDQNCKCVVNFSRALVRHQNLKAVQIETRAHEIDLAISKRKLLVFRMKICSNSFQLLLEFMSAENVKQIDVLGHPEAFEDCSQCGSYGRDAVQSLCKVLHRSESIQAVHLDGCRLSNETAVSLTSSLSTKKSHIYVNMEGSKVSTKGLVSILNNLAINVHCMVFGIEFYIDEDMLVHLSPPPSTYPDSEAHLSHLVENISSRFIGFGINILNLSQKLLVSLLQASEKVKYLKIQNFELNDISYETKHQRVHVSPKELSLSNCRQKATLNAENIPETQAIQTMLATMTSLQAFTLRDSEINDGVISHIAAGLTYNTTLLELDVSGNHSITSHGWVQLFNTLTLGPTPLQKLDVSENTLDLESSTALNEMLCLHQTLATLKVRCCSINDLNLETLVSGISYDASLKEIDVSQNSWITSKGWVTFFQALQSTSINTIDVSFNELGNDGLSALDELIHLNETITVLL